MVEQEENLLEDLGYETWKIAADTKLKEIGPDLSSKAEQEWQENWGDSADEETKYFFMENWLSNYKDGNVTSEGEIEGAVEEVAIELSLIHI